MNAQGMHDSNEKQRVSRWPRRHGVWFGALVGGVAGALAAGALVGAASASAAGWMSHRGQHGWRAGGSDPEAVRERAEFAVSFVMNRIEASDEQQAEARAIVLRAIDDLLPLGQHHQGHNEALMEELTKPTIDRVALERIRQSGLEMADEASGRLVDSLADLGDVLTQEQRVELAERLRRFRH